MHACTAVWKLWLWRNSCWYQICTCMYTYNVTKWHLKDTKVSVTKSILIHGMIKECMTLLCFKSPHKMLKWPLRPSSIAHIYKGECKHKLVSPRQVFLLIFCLVVHKRTRLLAAADGNAQRTPELRSVRHSPWTMMEWNDNSKQIANEQSNCTFIHAWNQMELMSLRLFPVR